MHADSMILAFDTSLPVMSVAVVGAEGALAAVQLESRESRNEKLLPAIDWLLGEARVDRSQISAIGVTRGPGSFTGVRIGLATAEGLSLALAIPICALPTHEVVARSVPGRSVLVCSDALRGESYVSGYAAGVETLSCRVVSGATLEELSARFEERAIAEIVAWERNLALLAAGRTGEILAAGDAARYSDTTPLYVRLAEAEARLLAGNV